MLVPFDFCVSKKKMVKVKLILTERARALKPIFYKDLPHCKLCFAYIISHTCAY